MLIRDRRSGEWKETPRTEARREQREKSVLDFRRAEQPMQKVNALARYLGIEVLEEE